MKIFFIGLGPNDSISYNGKLYKNSDVVDMEYDFAQDYIDLGLAKPLINEQDKKEVIELGVLETKNANTRKQLEAERRSIS